MTVDEEDEWLQYHCILSEEHAAMKKKIEAEAKQTGSMGKGKKPKRAA